MYKMVVMMGSPRLH